MLLRNSLVSLAALVFVLGGMVLMTSRPSRGFSQTINPPALQPVQFSLLPHSSTTNTNAVYFQVPVGKRLVIDYISSQAQDLSGGAAAMTIGTTVNGNFVSYLVYVNKNDTNAVNQPVAIYADPGTTVQAFAFNSGATCGGLLSCSGHYVSPL